MNTFKDKYGKVETTQLSLMSLPISSLTHDLLISHDPQSSLDNTVQLISLPVLFKEIACYSFGDFVSKTTHSIVNFALIFQKAGFDNSVVDDN